MTTEPADIRDYEDRADLDACVEGDAAALARLYHRHRGVLMAYVRSIVGDGPLAEEVVQDTLLAVWKGARSFEGRARVRTWMLGISRRQALGRLRRKRFRVVGIDHAAELEATGRSPEDMAIGSVAADDTARCIATLSPVHREILVLFFLDDLSYAEAAQVLDIPVGTVRSRLFNARAALLQRLAEEEIS